MATEVASAYFDCVSQITATINCAVVVDSIPFLSYSPLHTVSWGLEAGNEVAAVSHLRDTGSPALTAGGLVVM